MQCTKTKHNTFWSDQFHTAHTFEQSLHFVEIIQRLKIAYLHHWNRKPEQIKLLRWMKWLGSLCTIRIKIIVYVKLIRCYGHINCNIFGYSLENSFLSFAMLNVRQSVAQMCVGMSCVSYLSDVLCRKHSELKWMWLNIKVMHSILSSRWNGFVERTLWVEMWNACRMCDCSSLPTANLWRLLVCRAND